MSQFGTQRGLAPERGQARRSGQVIDIQSPSTASVNPLTVEVDSGTGHGMMRRFVVENNQGADSIDIDFYGASVTVGSTDPVVSPSGTAMSFYGPLGDTSNPIVIYQAGQGSTGSKSLIFTRIGEIESFAPNLATNWLYFAAYGAANPMFAITQTNGGQFNWGAGGASATDTTLYRSSAGVLKTDGQFLTGSSVTIVSGDARAVRVGAVNSISGISFQNAEAGSQIARIAAGVFGFGTATLTAPTMSAGTGAAVILGKLTTAPSTNPVGGGIIYCDTDGSLKYRSPAGTVTTMGAA